MSVPILRGNGKGFGIVSSVHVDDGGVFRSVSLLASVKLAWHMLAFLDIIPNIS
jgi:hypothetical protein